MLAAARQLLVIVDDLQWADDASAQFLHYLARQTASLPVLALYAYRDEELDSRARLAELVASLRREPHARHMPLARLRLADTKELLAGHGGAELAARLQRETDGNAFFLTSMLHALREGEIAGDAAGELPLPEALRASVRARLAHVPADARPTLDVAAVLGRRFDFESLFAVMKTSEDELLRAVETLVRRRLLREESAGTYDFSHDKVREVAYLEIGGARRRLLHKAVAETLEQQGEGEPHERDARLAEHYERGHVWSKAVHYMVLAAQRSQKLFAVREALDWFDRAIELASAHPGALTERALIDVHEQRGRARAQAGQTEGAVADIRIVIDAARARGDRTKARDALIQLGMTYRRGDDYRAAVECLGQALDECRALGDERQAADTLYHLGTVMWSDGRNRDATAYHAEAVDDLRAPRPLRLGRRAGLPRPRRGAFLEPRASGRDSLLPALDRARAQHRRQELRVREPDDGGVLVLRLHGIRRLRAGARELRGRARDRAARRPAVAHPSHEPRARLCARVPRRIRQRPE